MNLYQILALIIDPWVVGQINNFICVFVFMCV